MTSEEGARPGAAKPANIKKAACGIRYEDDELSEGVDFTAAASLLSDNEPTDRETSSNSVADQNQKANLDDEAS